MQIKSRRLEDFFARYFTVQELHGLAKALDRQEELDFPEPDQDSRRSYAGRLVEYLEHRSQIDSQLHTELRNRRRSRRHLAELTIIFDEEAGSEVARPPFTESTPRPQLRPNARLVLVGDLPANSIEFAYLVAEAIRAVAEEYQVTVCVIERTDLRDRIDVIDFATTVGQQLLGLGNLNLRWAPAKTGASPPDRFADVQQRTVEDVLSKLKGEPSAVLSMGGTSDFAETLQEWHRQVRRAPIRRPWLWLPATGGLSQRMFGRLRSAIYGPTDSALSASLLDRLDDLDTHELAPIAQAIEAMVALREWPRVRPDEPDLEDLVGDLAEADRTRSTSVQMLLPRLLVLVRNALRIVRRAEGLIRTRTVLIALAAAVPIVALLVWLYGSVQFESGMQLVQSRNDEDVFVRIQVIADSKVKELRAMLERVGDVTDSFAAQVEEQFEGPLSEPLDQIYVWNDFVRAESVSHVNQCQTSPGTPTLVEYFYADDGASYDDPLVKLVEPKDSWQDYSLEEKLVASRLRPLNAKMNRLRILEDYPFLSWERLPTRTSQTTSGLERLQRRAMTKTGGPLVWLYVGVAQPTMMFQHPGTKKLLDCYDPTKRPWFTAAKADRLVWTGPYPDAQANAIPVVTPARRVNAGGLEAVVAIDLAVWYLDEWLGAWAREIDENTVAALVRIPQEKGSACIVALSNGAEAKGLPTVSCGGTRKEDNCLGKTRTVKPLRALPSTWLDSRDPKIHRRHDEWLIVTVPLVEDPSDRQALPEWALVFARKDAN